GSENSGGELNSDISREMLKGETEADDGSGNKVMVVVDSNMESKGALHWALDDTVQNQDTMILLHIATGSKLDERVSSESKHVNFVAHDISNPIGVA
ncbi:universal stress protein PHOS32-like protein, partial [Tanacetum coccineum]